MPLSTVMVLLYNLSCVKLALKPTALVANRETLSQTVQLVRFVLLASPYLKVVIVLLLMHQPQQTLLPHALQDNLL